MTVNRFLCGDVIVWLLVCVALLQICPSRSQPNCGSFFPPPPAFPDFLSTFKASLVEFIDLPPPTNPTIDCAQRVPWPTFNRDPCFKNTTSLQEVCNPSTKIPVTPTTTTRTTPTTRSTASSSGTTTRRTSNPVVPTSTNVVPQSTDLPVSGSTSVFGSSTVSSTDVTSQETPSIGGVVKEEGGGRGGTRTIIAAVVGSVVGVMIVIAIVVFVVLRSRRNGRHCEKCLWFHELKGLRRQKSQLQPLAAPSTPSLSQPVTPSDNPAGVNWQTNGKNKFALLREDSAHSAIFPDTMTYKSSNQSGADTPTDVFPPKVTRQTSRVTLSVIGESSSDSTLRRPIDLIQFSKSIVDDDDEDEITKIIDDEETGVVVFAAEPSMLEESSTDMTLKRNLATTYADKSNKTVGAKQPGILSIGGEVGGASDEQQARPKSVTSQGGGSEKEHIKPTYQELSKVDDHPHNYQKLSGVENGAFIPDEDDDGDGDVDGKDIPPVISLNTSVMPLNITKDWDDWVDRAFDKVLEPSAGAPEVHNGRATSVSGSRLTPGDSPDLSVSPRDRPSKVRLHHADSDVNNENVLSVEPSDDNTATLSVAQAAARFETRSPSGESNVKNNRPTRFVFEPSSTSDGQTSRAARKNSGPASPTTPVNHSSKFSPNLTVMSPKIQNTLPKKPKANPKPESVLQKSSSFLPEKSPGPSVKKSGSIPPLKSPKPSKENVLSAPPKSPGLIGRENSNATPLAVDSQLSKDSNDSDDVTASTTVTSLRAQFEQPVVIVRQPSSPNGKPLVGKQTAANNLNKM